MKGRNKGPDRRIGAMMAANQRPDTAREIYDRLIRNRAVELLAPEREARGPVANAEEFHAESAWQENRLAQLVAMLTDAFPFQDCGELDRTNAHLVAAKLATALSAVKPSVGVGCAACGRETGTYTIPEGGPRAGGQHLCHACYRKFAPPCSSSHTAPPSVERVESIVAELGKMGLEVLQFNSRGTLIIEIGNRIGKPITIEEFEIAEEVFTSKNRAVPRLERIAAEEGADVGIARTVAEATDLVSRLEAAERRRFDTGGLPFDIVLQNADVAEFFSVDDAEVVRIMACADDHDYSSSADGIRHHPVPGSAYLIGAVGGDGWRCWYVRQGGENYAFFHG